MIQFLLEAYRLGLLCGLGRRNPEDDADLEASVGCALIYDDLINLLYGAWEDGRKAGTALVSV